MSIRKAITELLEADVISSETAQRIEAYYQSKSAHRANLPTIILTVLGTVLVGLGGILIIGHNWDNLSRFVKTLIAFLPLLTGQAACAYVLAKKRDSAVWAESTATFLFFAVGACIAMLAQVYNISSIEGQFMLSWFLLCLPLAYIMRSSTVLMLCVGLATYYVGETRGNLLYLALIAATLPYYYGLMRRATPSRFGYLLSWLLPLSFLVAFGVMLDHAHYTLLFIAYVALYAFLYQLGGIPLLQRQPAASNGYRVAGLLGISVMLLMFSFSWYWDELADNASRYSSDGSFFQEQHVSNILCAITLLLNLLTLLLYVLHRRTFPSKPANPIAPIAFACTLLVALVVFTSATHNSAAIMVTAAQWAVNILTLLLAVYYIRKGDRENRFAKLNYGLLLMAGLVACRFFDSNLPFLLRGIAFMLIGVMLILINSYMHKKRQRHVQS